MIAFISTGSLFFFREHDISKYPKIWVKVSFGIITGILGCLLMLYSITVVPSVIVDFRLISIVLASIFGGFISSIIASLAIGIFRITYFGVTNSSIIAFLIALVMGIGCPLIFMRIKTLNKRWIYATIFCLIVGSIAFAFLIKDTKVLFNLLLAYWITHLLIATFLYIYTSHLNSLYNLFKKYREESSKDFLTGLNNVRQFDKIFNTISNRALEREEHLSLLIIDVDYFKSINDTYGHIEGDIVLKQLGKIFVKTCRDFDIVSRNGGEEFTVMLIDCLPQQSINIAERIRIAVEKHPFVLSNGEIIYITISVGIASYPDTTEDLVKLIDEADAALYEAKHTGRNKVVFRSTKN